MSAIAADGPVIAEGTFLHIKTEALQKNSRVFGDGQTLDTNRESWVRWDGKTWAIDTRPSAGWREYHVIPRTDEEDALSNPTPEFAASLPDDPDTLRAYLDENVSGSNSHEEALFVAVADLARSHFLPPETLSAALQVLADVDGVETEDVTFQAGQPSRSRTPRSGVLQDASPSPWIATRRGFCPRASPTPGEPTTSQPPSLKWSRRSRRTFRLATENWSREPASSTEQKARER